MWSLWKQDRHKWQTQLHNTLGIYLESTHKLSDPDSSASEKSDHDTDDESYEEHSNYDKIMYFTFDIPYRDYFKKLFTEKSIFF